LPPAPLAKEEVGHPLRLDGWNLAKGVQLMDAPLALFHPTQHSGQLIITSMPYQLGLPVQHFLDVFFVRMARISFY
jgi:hypothetical protein